MNTTEIIDQIKSLPLDDRKAVLKALSDEIEEECDNRLFDERSKEPDGRTLLEIVGTFTDNSSDSAVKYVC